MNRQDLLAAAIRELVALIGSGESLEARYQEWFEDHPAAWEALGYSRAFRHVDLRHPDGRVITPDFIAVQPTNVADIVDLKRPDMTTIVQRETPRPRASAEVDKALTQLEDYAQCVAVEAERDRLEAEYSVEMPSMPDLVLIGGVGVDATVRREAIARYSAGGRFHTYDDVVHALLSRYGQEFDESVENTYFGFHSIMKVEEFPDETLEHTLFDFGGGTSASSIRMIVDREHRLGLKVEDENGLFWTVRTTDALPAGVWAWVVFEVSVTDVMAALTIKVDGGTAARRQENVLFEFDPHVLARMTMGANHGGRSGGAFSVHFHGVWDQRPEDLVERARFEAWALTQVEVGNLQGIRAVQFEEHQFLETEPDAERAR